ncbi:MAG: response regulator transcription factor [Roseivirga sp.]|nr:response regulator transcription factor [Roseivirga sp.]
MTLNCLVVDDEPIARNILEKYVAKTPMLRLEGSIDNGLEVIGKLSEGKIDLMFLDINMPEFTGIDLLKSMRNPPAVIITTAYAEYGAESYEYEVIDYLMKPIPFDRFLKAIQKVVALKEKDDQTDPSSEKSPAFIFLKEDHLTHKVLFEDIHYVQAYGNYLKVHLAEKVLLVRKTISDLESESAGRLTRIHKSYMINLSHLISTEGNEVLILGQQRLPIGKVYKKDFDKLIGG